ncbi:Putative ribonuclease H protein [Arachis hypogaea]|nr:Putative ribonuclease H protein [Arachis hypogaea]
MGFTKIKIETDSICAVRILQNNSNTLHSCTTLTRAIKELQATPNNFSITHIWREANFSVDALAKHAHSLTLGIHYFSATPLFFALLLDADRRQVVFVRVLNT